MDLTQNEQFFTNTYNLEPGDSKEFVLIGWRDFKEA